MGKLTARRCDCGTLQSEAGRFDGAARVVGPSGVRYNPARPDKLSNIRLCLGDKATSAHRIGIGHDTHRLAPGGPLRLGGIDVPATAQAVGHSDADVLLHALTDALLGAASLGDIGEMFPNTDPANRGRDSGEMLSLAWQAVRGQRFQIVNLDCIVFLQEPKLSPYKMSIRERIAELLELPVDRVGLKAKTGEGVGPVGRQEAIMAECVVLLERSE